METLILSNPKVHITFNPETKEISGADKTDPYNWPRFYNLTKRSNKKGWQELTAQWNDDVGMYEAIDILWSNGVKCHSYCSMD